MSSGPNGKDGSPFITTVQAAAMLKLSPRTLEKMRQRGIGPEYFKILNRAYYTCKTVSVWSDAMLRKATFDPPKEPPEPNAHTQAGNHPDAGGS